jgi:hypothetical protein
MTASISKSPSGGVYAFLGKEPLPPCAMVHGKPVVDAVLDVADVEHWVTTLEEVLPNVPIGHYGTLSMMIVRLQVILDRHQQEHETIITEAPTPEDMVEYLSAYLKVMAPKTPCCGHVNV